MAVVVLSEDTKVQQLQNTISHCNINSDKSCITLHTWDLNSSPVPGTVLEIRSSLEFPLLSSTDNDGDKDYAQKLGKGYNPSPAALLDAISSILISPRGFGGSSGFGTKHAVRF